MNLSQTRLLLPLACFAAAMCLTWVDTQPADAELLVHYQFDALGTPVGGANFEVTNQGVLGATHNGDGFGGTSIVNDATFGDVVQFTNANGSFVRIGDSGASGGIPGGPQTTISAWYRGTDFNHMFDQDDNAGERLVITGGGGSNVRVYDGDFEDTMFNLGNLQDGEWHHWAVTVDGDSGVGQLYFDGDAVGSSLSNLTLWDLVSGDTTQWGASTTSPFDNVSSGLHHDIRIYDEVLTAGQISALAGNAVPEPASLALWLCLGAATLLGGRRMALRRRRRA